MLISFIQDPEFRNTVPIVTIDRNEIDNVQHAKLLRVTISSDLTWTLRILLQKLGRECICDIN